MVFGDRSIFIKCLFVFAECIHQRSLMVSYYRYLFWRLNRRCDFEVRWNYIKMLFRNKEFLNIKQKR